MENASTGLHYRLHRDRRSSHQRIAALVRRVDRPPVLDVGAAQGFLGQLLADDGLVIDAVEPNPRWVEHARPFYRHIHAATVEHADLANQAYGTVVCGDVLEHLVDPVAVLGQLRRVAASDARFVVSVPNIAHLAVRLLLLAGRFPQMDRGILDRTHLHFWTRDTATAMLAEAGLRVVHAEATGVPLDELWPAGQGTPLFRGAAALQQVAVDVAPRVFGFQWIFVCIAT